MRQSPRTRQGKRQIAARQPVAAEVAADPEEVVGVEVDEAVVAVGAEGVGVSRREVGAAGWQKRISTYGGRKKMGDARMEDQMSWVGDSVRSRKPTIDHVH